MHCGGAKNNMVVIAQHEGNLYHRVSQSCAEQSDQLFAFSCRWQCNGALAMPIQIFGCEEHLYTPKHGEGHEFR